MAIKKSARTNRHKPTSLDRTVSFGEERNGGTRISRPGTSPTSPPHRRYPITSPIANQWVQPRNPEKMNGMLNHLAAPFKPNGEAARRCDEHHTFPNIELPTFDTSPTDADIHYSDEDFQALEPFHVPGSPLVTTGVRRLTGDNEYQNGASWPDQTENMTHINAVGDYTEKCICVGDKNSAGNEHSMDCVQYKSSAGDADKSVDIPTCPVRVTKSHGRRSRMNCLQTGSAPGATTAPSSTSKVTKSTTKKAKKNRKAREKKAHEKRNLRKREKLPYVPEHALEEKTMTRSRAKLHHVHTKDFYALS